jgi:SulP family sulfate permease
VAVLLVCFSLTVLFDMVVAVSVGIVMAALLFMRRMAELSGSRLVDNGQATSREGLAEGVIVYEIAGPLFFGAADKAVSGIATSGEIKLLVLDMHAVPAMDATGLVAFQSLLKRVKLQGTRVAIAGLSAQPQGVLERAGITETPGELSFHPSVDAALKA